MFKKYFLKEVPGMKGTTGRLLLFIVFLGMMGGVFVWKNAGMSEADRTVRQVLPGMVQVSSPTCPLA